MNIKQFLDEFNEQASSFDNLELVNSHQNNNIVSVSCINNEKLLNKNNIQIEVVNNVENTKEDLIQDFISIITSFSARIYGQRRSKRKTEELIKELEKK